MGSDILQSILNDLSHLVVPPSRLAFENDAEIGVGGYGEVYLATLTGSSDAPPRKVAVKKLRIVQPKEIRSRISIRLVRELKVWSAAKHPNILELVGFYLDENCGSAQFVSGYMAHGNVKDYIKRCQPNLALRLQFVQGITSGVNYLHTYNPPICHGDLKPSNVLVTDDIEVVLCDFGLATFIEASGVASGLTTSKSVKGSTRYMSPELLQHTGERHTLGSDMWAWGCTTFEIITNCEPYHTALIEVHVVSSLVRGEKPGSLDMFNDLAPDNLASKISESLETPEDFAIESSGSVHASDDLALESSGSVHALDDLFESSGSVHAFDDLSLESSRSVHAPAHLPLESPGSIHAPDDPTPDDRALDTNINCRPTLDSLRCVIMECWDPDSVKRPSSSAIINRVFFVEASDASSAPGVHGESQDTARLALETEPDNMDSHTNLLGEPWRLIGGSPYSEAGEKDGIRSNTSGWTLFPTLDAKRTPPGRKGTSHKASPTTPKRKRAEEIASTPSGVSTAIHTDTVSGPRKRRRKQLVDPSSAKSVSTASSAADTAERNNSSPFSGVADPSDTNALIPDILSSDGVLTGVDRHQVNQGQARPDVSDAREWSTRYPLPPFPAMFPDPSYVAATEYHYPLFPPFEGGYSTVTPAYAQYAAYHQPQAQPQQQVFLSQQSSSPSEFAAPAPPSFRGPETSAERRSLSGPSSPPPL